MTSAGEAALERESWRMRDDLDEGSFSARLAAHWASTTPQRYKDTFEERVVAFMQPRSHSEVPNYSVGTRGLPFMNQLPFDGESYRGDPLLY